MLLRAIPLLLKVMQWREDTIINSWLKPCISEEFVFQAMMCNVIKRKMDSSLSLDVEKLSKYRHYYISNVETNYFNCNLSILVLHSFVSGNCFLNFRKFCVTLLAFRFKPHEPCRFRALFIYINTAQIKSLKLKRI